MTSEDQSGTMERPRGDEQRMLTREDVEGDLRAISTECPECKTDTTLYDIVTEGKCAGYLYDLADCNATLSVDLVTRSETE